jgi:hypothetical protein
MNMKQGFYEKASEFLQRICKQIYVCKIVGCNDYNEVTALNSLVNIILQWLNGNVRAYSATITELRACFHVNPSSIYLMYLEEVTLTVITLTSTEVEVTLLHDILLWTVEDFFENLLCVWNNIIKKII